MTREDILTALIAADPAAALRAHDLHELHTRFARAQVRLKNVDKSRFVDAGSKKYNFAPLDEFLSMARAELGAEGLSFHQPCFTALEGAEVVITVQTVISFGVASIECSYSKSAPKNDIQGQGSMMTYLRRYGIQSMIGVCGFVDEDDDAVSVKTGPRVESDKPAERERAAEIRSAAKQKAEAQREPQHEEPVRPWPALDFRADPPEVADTRYVGGAVMEILGPDFFGNPRDRAMIHQTALDVGEAMLSKAPTRPQGPDQVMAYVEKMKGSIKANPQRLTEIKERIASVLVPF